MIDLRQMCSFLNYCGITDPSKCFGIPATSVDKLPEYISVSAALLDSVLSEDTDKAVSTALAYIMNLSEIDSTSVSEDVIKKVIDTLFSVVSGSDSVQAYVTLYMYTGLDEILQILMTYSDLSFHDAVLLLIAADIVPHAHKREYVERSIDCMEYSLIEKRYDLQNMPDSLSILYVYQDHVQTSRILKRLPKLFTSVPSVNSFLCKVGFSLVDLLYLSYYLSGNSSFTELSDKRARLSEKYCAACILSEDPMNDSMKSLVMEALNDIYYYCFNTKAYTCGNFQNMKWLCRCNRLKGKWTFPIFDMQYLTWSKYLLHVDTGSFIRLILAQIKDTPPEQARALFDSIPGLQIYITSMSGYNIRAFVEALIKSSVYTISDLISYAPSAGIAWVLDNYGSALTIQSVFDTLQDIGEKRIAALHYMSACDDCITEDNFQDYLKYVLPVCIGVHGQLCGTSSFSVDDEYFVHNLGLLNIYVVNLLKDNDEIMKLKEKRKYAKAVVRYLNSVQMEVPDFVQRLALTEREYDTYRRESVYTQRNEAFTELAELSDLNALRAWFRQVETPDYASDLILRRIYELCNECSIQDIMIFVGYAYDYLVKVYINPDRLLDTLRCRKEAAC